MQRSNSPLSPPPSPAESHRVLHALSRAPSASALNRRNFLQGVLAAGSLAMLPSVFARPAEAAPLGPNERVLVVFVLGGGNDGLNMIAPAANGYYRDARGALAIDAADALSIGSDLYVHPSMPNLHRRYQGGDVAIVQGVGDPVDDHSHFSSMARWMVGSSANVDHSNATGWAGRYLDDAGLGDYAGLVIGDGGVPLHMIGESSDVTALPTWGVLLGAGAEPWEIAQVQAIQQMRDGDTGLGPWGELVAETFGGAVDAAQIMKPIYADGLPEGGAVRDLELAARLVNLDIGARVITVTKGNFDQHDDQLGIHAQNLADVDLGIEQFFTTLDPAFADRVTLMTFSEFGRSFSANASRGTDHGTASASLIVGAPIKGGLYGQMPSFTDRDELGDLKHTVDFRSVYATMLEGWMGSDASDNLGANYELLDVFDSDVPAPTATPIVPSTPTPTPTPVPATPTPTTTPVPPTATPSPTPLPPDPAPAGAIEFGRLRFEQVADDQWFAVPLTRPFTNPVVIMGVPTADGADPSTMRIRNVTPTGFEFQIDEWDYLNGYHIPEDVAWLAVDEGNHFVDGQYWRAGFVEAAESWTRTSFAGGEFGDDGYVLLAQHHAASQSDPALTVRVKDVARSSFSVKCQREQANQWSGTLPAVRVGYVATSPGSGTINGIPFTGGVNAQTGDTLAEGRVSFSIPMPAVFGQITSYRGGDTAALRYQEDKDGARFKVEEEKSLDDEVVHVDEEVRWLAISVA